MSFWKDTGVSTPTITLSSPSLYCCYKCVVSNAGGDVETNGTIVNNIIVHGTEYPEHSGIYYAAVAIPSFYALDEKSQTLLMKQASLL